MIDRKLQIENRIARLKENGNIIKKLQRQLKKVN